MWVTQDIGVVMQKTKERTAHNDKESCQVYNCAVCLEEDQSTLDSMVSGLRSPRKRWAWCKNSSVEYIQISDRTVNLIWKCPEKIFWIVTLFVFWPLPIKYFPFNALDFVPSLMEPNEQNFSYPSLSSLTLHQKLSILTAFCIWQWISQKNKIKIKYPCHRLAS